MLTMPSASTESDFISFTQAAVAVMARTGRYHSPHNVANAARRMGAITTGPDGREGTTARTAAKLADHYISSGGYFTPRAHTPGTPNAA
jgi:hypothetical protein